MEAASRLRQAQAAITWTWPVSANARIRSSRVTSVAPNARVVASRKRSTGSPGRVVGKLTLSITTSGSTRPTNSIPGWASERLSDPNADWERQDDAPSRFEEREFPHRRDRDERPAGSRDGFDGVASLRPYLPGHSEGKPEPDMSVEQKPRRPGHFFLLLGRDSATRLPLRVGRPSYKESSSPLEAAGSGTRTRMMSPRISPLPAI